MSQEIKAPQPDDGGPAFPVVEQQDKFENVVAYHAPGMSLRDYFAAQFMSRAASLVEDRGGWDMGNAANCAYAMADAMLKARTA